MLETRSTGFIKMSIGLVWGQTLQTYSSIMQALCGQQTEDVMKLAQVLTPKSLKYLQNLC